MSETQDKIKKLNKHSKKITRDFNMLEGYIKHISFVKSQIKIHGLKSNDLEEILAMNDNISGIYSKCKETMSLMNEELDSIPLDVLHQNDSVMIHSPEYILDLLKDCHKDNFYIAVTKIDKLKDVKYKKSLNRKFLDNTGKLLLKIFAGKDYGAFHIYFKKSYKLITIIEAKQKDKNEDIKLLKQYRGLFSKDVVRKYFYDKYKKDSYIDLSTNIFLIDTKEHLIKILEKDRDSVVEL
ncbi:MAG: hypothetical protein U9N42_09290 [Campylobacterota bacterium]|nr:hypothetical protein [Campylobacterota bacterium]